MSSNNNTNTKKKNDLMSAISQVINRLSEKIRSYDRYALTSFITGVIFFILGTIMLVLIIAVPASCTFDHIAVIILDYIITALCIVYVLYKSGRLENFLAGSMADREESQEQDVGLQQSSPITDKPEPPANTPELSVPAFIGIGHLRSSAEHSAPRRRTSALVAIDESLISPGHRYSPARANGNNAFSSQK